MSSGVRIFRAGDATPLGDSRMNAGVDFGGDERVARAVGGLAAAAGFDTRVLVEQSADDGGMSLTYAYFKPGYPLFRHRHETNCLYLVVSGSLQMGQQTLWPGDAFLVPAHAPYGYSAGPDGVEVIEFRSDPTPFTTSFARIPAEQVADAEATADERGADWAEHPTGPMLTANPGVASPILGSRRGGSQRGNAPGTPPSIGSTDPVVRDESSDR
ncbi:MAG: cupin domain-containing protein [Acidimicrobiia bacterium]